MWQETLGRYIRNEQFILGSSENGADVDEDVKDTSYLRTFVYLS